MLNQKKSSNAKTMLLSVTISLVAAEIYLHVTTRPEYFLDQRAESYFEALKGSPVHQTNEVIDIVPDSELGWRMKPFFNKEGVHHNSRGFRSNREYPLKPGTPRILAIGDSMTYGLGVQDNSTFPAYLEQMTGIEVVNAGVNAYGADQALRMWEIEGERLHPTHVILGYTVDDFFRNELSFRDAAKPRFMLDPTTQQFILKPIGDGYANSSNASSWPILERSLKVPQAIGWLLRRVRLKFGLLDEKRLARAAKTSEYILQRLQSSVTRSGARLLVVVIGYRDYKQPEHLWIEKSIMDACRSNGIECLNLAAASREVDPNILYAPNAHFSEEGHRFAAQKIATFFKLPGHSKN